MQERLVELAGDLLPSLTPPPGYSRSEVAASTALNCREEEQRRLEEDELKEAKQKEKAKILEEKMVRFINMDVYLVHMTRWSLLVLYYELLLICLPNAHHLCSIIWKCWLTERGSML